MLVNAPGRDLYREHNPRSQRLGYCIADSTRSVGVNRSLEGDARATHLLTAPCNRTASGISSSEAHAILCAMPVPSSHAQPQRSLLYEDAPQSFRRGLWLVFHIESLFSVIVKFVVCVLLFDLYVQTPNTPSGERVDQRSIHYG